MNTSKYYPLSFSSIKNFATSPAHFVAYKNREQHETPAMRFGTAVHAAILEPKEFAKDYKVLEVRRGTKAYKELQDAHPNAIWLSPSEYNEIQKIKEAVEAHPVASKILKDCIAFEQELKGSINGVPFRGFADGFSPKYCVDLKTCQKGSPRDFTNDSYRQKYHIQGYIYCRLLEETLGHKINEHWIIALEKTSPYVVTCYKLTPEIIERGKAELESLLKTFKTWNGEATGYDEVTPFGYFDLDVPAWAI